MVDGGCPVRRGELPCPDKPVAANITVTAIGTRQRVAVVVSDAQGRFEVPLAPGNYLIGATKIGGALLPSARNTQVTVERGNYRDITIPFDSGIR